jgi:hypothetical protein
LIWWFFFVAYLMVLFHIIADLFRDRTLNGWVRAIWVVALLIAPFGTLIYLIARGRGMGERAATAAQNTRAQTDQYIQSVAGQSNPADQISSAKSLLDNGTITQTEYEHLKSKALA